VTGLERLSVAVSDPELHAIETVESFETTGSFLVAITNHGRDAHVHLALDDALAAVAELGDPNVYVERDATREVEVSVDPDATRTEGAVRIQTGYGAETAVVSVAVGAPDRAAVEVDETLGDPTEPPADDRTTDPPGIPGGGWVPVAALAVAALAIAAATAALANDPVVVAGVVVVLLGVLAAGAILLRP
jgi:hypothetical protein